MTSSQWRNKHQQSVSEADSRPMFWIGVVQKKLFQEWYENQVSTAHCERGMESSPIISFKQRNNLTRIELTLHPDYVEYHIRAPNEDTGFNVAYAALPNSFNYRTYRPKDAFVTFPLFLVAGMTLFELVMYKRNTYSTLAAMLASAAVYCGIGYALRRLIKRDYTVLATPAGNVLIVKDRQHDQILSEFEARRFGALKRAAVVNRLEAPWNEIKKFKWLRAEGVISDAEFDMYRAQILSSSEAPSGKPVAALALH